MKESNPKTTNKPCVKCKGHVCVVKTTGKPPKRACCNPDCGYEEDE